jgi:DNA-binding ferritin-like protein
MTRFKSDLTAVLVDLLASYRLLQTLHWQARGESYYGDHLLYQRIYEAIPKEIDAVAERLVGLYGEDPVDADHLESAVARRLRAWKMSGAAQVQRALSVERAILATVQRALETLDGTDPGTENLLAGIADTHLGHLYLLQQRAKA